MNAVMVSKPVGAKKEALKTIKILNAVAIIWDSLLAIFYLVIFLMLFSAIEVPDSSGALEYPETTTKVMYELFGSMYSIQTINTVLFFAVLFMLIGAVLVFMNIKHLKGLQPREFHRWEAGNTFVQALLSLLTVNVVSCVIRMINADLILNYTEDVHVFSFLKKLNGEIKEKRKIKKENKGKELTADEIVIRNKVKKQTVAKIIRYSATYLVLILFALFILIPFYWMLLTSLKTFQQSKATVPELWVPIKNLQWLNLKFVIENLSFGKYIKNTIIVAVLSTLGTVITTVLSAFAFSRLEFKGRELVFSILLGTMMIPGEIYMITNFLTVSKSGFGWIGTDNSGAIGYFATMILPFMVSIFYIFLLRQTFKQIPDSLYKAAKVDGCSDLKYLMRVMIPIAAPTILTITILSILGSWNAFVWPRLITAVDPSVGKDYWLVSVALRDGKFVLDKGTGAAESMYNLQLAASTIVTVPLLIVFMIFRKRIMSGVGRSGTKG